ncbi:LacI family DNA-binding transcriptional regulator [Salimicrobium salexigens]|uniref:Transcriptional regulator, LacI family n=1 Tax=Salimicrobium salexigens TaxID=908941 RepID=A0ABY1KUI2_9BACI|nr:LacI family DNA-binding transcriptional regulator [Salimicrobium salexigens]SIS80687.1 transcriptional regulator, LacI family [Salimicrobium salexigens]
MSVTIKDVAKEAGVAPSTVSRVIADSPRISQVTKKKVKKVMEDMGYHMNYNARVLVRQATQKIGVVMKHSSSHSFDNPFFSEVLSGISKACQENDYSLNLTTGESEEAIFRDVIKMVQGKRVDAIVVLYSKEDDQVVPYLMQQNFPFVMVGKPLMEASNIMYVDNDNVQASNEATDYLIQLGHERIGIVGGEADFEVTKARVEGYKKALALHGCPQNASYIKYRKDGSYDGTIIAEELLGLPEPPTALVIMDDFHALSIITALKEAGVSVPGDMSVISFNNTIVSRLSSPSLTTVDTNAGQLGYYSADTLIEKLQKPAMMNKSLIIPTNIVERESCRELK